MDFRQSESKCNRTAKREARTKTKNSQRNWPLLCKWASDRQGSRRIGKSKVRCFKKKPIALRMGLYAAKCAPKHHER